MKLLRNVLAIGMIGLLGMQIQAQSIVEKSVDRVWGAEVNPLWPFVPGVGIYTAKATYTFWNRGLAHGDFTFGVLWRPGTSGDENAERFSEFGLNVGYRHYFWKGFHLEMAFYPSIAQETNNKIDGKDYRGFALTTELYTGYKFNLANRSNYSFYLMPQAGIGYNPISNLGPQTEESSAFPTLNLQVGLNF